MSLRKGILILIGFSAGGSIAAGVFAFLAAIGVFPRLIGKTRIRRYIRACETATILGGMFGNLFNIYSFPIWFGGKGLLLIVGGGVGIFVGCLAMSLAETLQAFPVICRRIRLAFGMQWLVVSFAFGKMMGAVCYFLNGWGK